MTVPHAVSLLLVPFLLVGCASAGPGSASPKATPPTTTPAGEAMVLDLYDVKDMTLPITSWPGGNGLESPIPAEVPRFLDFRGDELAEMIRATVDAPAFGRGAVIEFREGGVLIVKAPPETHARISRLLEGLRAAARR